MKISRKIETDKRTKRRIKVSTHKTQCILQFDQVTLKMKLPEAERIAEQLSLSVQIIKTRRANSKRKRI